MWIWRTLLNADFVVESPPDLLDEIPNSISVFVGSWEQNILYFKNLVAELIDYVCLSWLCLSWLNLSWLCFIIISIILCCWFGAKLKSLGNNKTCTHAPMHSYHTAFSGFYQILIGVPSNNRFLFRRRS